MKKILILGLLLIVGIIAIKILYSYFKLKKTAKEAYITVANLENQLDRILAIENDVECVQAIEKYILSRVKKNEDRNNLSPEQFNFLLVEELLREINNGGFHQYYFNSSGNYANRVEEALIAIGAYKTAKIVVKANKQFPNSKVPKRRDERIKVLEEIRAKSESVWSNLNNKFYSLNPITGELDIDSIAALQIRYAKENKFKIL